MFFLIWQKIEVTLFVLSLASGFPVSTSGFHRLSHDTGWAGCVILLPSIKGKLSILNASFSGLSLCVAFVALGYLLE